ncbi:hypothetical protein LINPERHAP1_LOCUS4389 [Linum perenne]
MEALQRMNDLLMEKEKEIQDLEAELELYRNTFLSEDKTEARYTGTSERRKRYNPVHLNHPGDLLLIEHGRRQNSESALDMRLQALCGSHDPRSPPSGSWKRLNKPNPRHFPCRAADRSVCH